MEDLDHWDFSNQKMIEKPRGNHNSVYYRFLDHLGPTSTVGFNQWFILLGSDWNHGMDYDFPFSWEFHHPNWTNSIIFQRGRRKTTNQIVIQLTGNHRDACVNFASVTGGWCRSVWLNGTCRRDEVFMILPVGIVGFRVATLGN